MITLSQCFLLASLIAVASCTFGGIFELPKKLLSAAVKAVEDAVPPMMSVVSELTALPVRAARVVQDILPFDVPIVETVEEFVNLFTLNSSLIQLPRLLLFPDNNGDLRPGTIYGTATEEPVHQSDVFFTLYTRYGPPEGELIVTGDIESVRRSHFNPSLYTYFNTHGFIQSTEGDVDQRIKNMYIANHDCNVILIDWSKISHNPLYFFVRMQIPQVARIAALFTAFLVTEAGADLSKIHLTGHSLGGHIVGLMGKNIQLLLGQKVARITGLDPAGPLFTILDPSSRLDKGDAEFVDVIHTCSGWLGFVLPIGHADFYPNGGYLRQPGCPFDFGLAGACSHSSSWYFYAESINTTRFLARPCSSYMQAMLGTCSEGPKVPMGHYLQPGTVGVYYLETADKSPYALG